MKMILMPTRLRFSMSLLLAALLTIATETQAQVCTLPNAVIYGLTQDGAIYPINVSNASLGTIIHNSTYSGNGPSKSNGLAYSNTSSKFYYFKRNVGNLPQEFVSYDPGTNIVSIRANSTCVEETHTGCLTANGMSYYTIDIDANLNYYNVVTNTWTFITSNLTDQFGNNVSTIIRNQNAGDIAFDGNNNLWLVTSSSTNYGVYRLPAPLPTTAVASITVFRRVNPNTATPNGNMIAGIAFNQTGQIYMSTKNDDRLYRLENNLSLTYIGQFPVSDVGNDMTSCAFPFMVLPLTWLEFSADVINDKEVKLEWQVAEKHSSGFMIEYSEDGKNWRELSHVKSEPTDVGGLTYSFNHKHPVQGANYYRIKTQSEPGKTSYSVIRMVLIRSAGNSISIWPNPAIEKLNLDGNNEMTRKVIVTDITGRTQMEKMLQPGEKSLQMRSLRPGLYVLTINTSDGRTRKLSFVKQ